MTWKDYLGLLAVGAVVGTVIMGWLALVRGA